MQADPFDVAKLVPLLIGYHERWSAEMENYAVLAVEAEFRVPVINPETGAPSRTWTLGGKLDVLLRDIARNVRFVLDHKFTTEDVSPGSDYMKRLRLDGQISIYHDGASAFGQPIDAFLYDVIKKPTQRPSQIPLTDEQGVKIVLDAAGQRVRTKDGKKYRETGDAAQGYVLQTRDETPDEFRDRIADAIAGNPSAYYQRAEIVRLEAEMDEARLDVWQLGKQMAEAQRLGRFPRNPDACVRYGRTCEFFGVCTGEASLEDPSLFRRSEVLHPELSSNADERLLTSSRLKDARACQRLHRLKYLDGYRAATEAETLRFGSLGHLALEAWWKAPPETRLDAALDALRNPEVPAAMTAAVHA